MRSLFCSSTLLIVVVIIFRENVSGHFRFNDIEEEFNWKCLKINFQKKLAALTGNKIVLHDKTAEQKAPVANASHFGYDKEDGPKVWPELFADCGGCSQSPINLDTTAARTYHNPRIMWWNYDLKPKKMYLLNNGHSVMLRAEWEKEEDKPYHWTFPDRDEYVFEQLHFHWGVDDSSGSEHTINYERFALEMHVVHYRKDLKSMALAQNQPNGVRVLGYLFRISETRHRNNGLQRIVDLLNDIVQADSSTTVDPFPLSRIVPDFQTQYFMYDGSLTTPPCSETVSWVVRKDPLIVCDAQMQGFRKLLNHEGEPVTHNFRPLQPLNGRTVIQVR